MRAVMALSAWLAVGLLIPAAHAAGMTGIDQSPIVRVLRLSDVPSLRNVELPSGALNAAQFAMSNNAMPSDARAEARVLSEGGFRSSAICEFSGSPQLVLKSGAIEFGSASKAAKVVAPLARLSQTSQAPPHTTVRTSPDHHFSHALLLTFRPSRSGDAGGYELLASAGRFAYTLQGINKPDGVSLAALERLLKAIISRSAAH